MQIPITPANKIGDSTCALKSKPSERLPQAAIALDEDGYIRACGSSVESLTGYSQQELLWQHISCLFPKLTDVVLMHGNRLNPLLNYFGRSDQFFEAISKQSENIICNLNFLMTGRTVTPNIRLIVRPVKNKKP